MRKPSRRGVAPAGPKRYRGEQTEPAPAPEPLPPEELEDGARAAEHRAFMGLRLLASLLDVAIVAGFGALLVLAISGLFQSSLKAYGFQLNGAMALLPVVVLYFSYFSSEAFTGVSLGKRLMGLEIRKQSGLSASEDSLTRRFTLKHAPLLLLLSALIFESPLLNSIALLCLAMYVASLMMGFGAARLCLHDMGSSLAVFPKRVPNINLNLLTPGKSKEEVAAELGKLKRERERSGKQGRTPSAENFPCAVEVKIYAHPREGLSDELLESFSRFVPEVHPRQIREAPPKGSYATYKVVMRFDEPLQMEASYEAVQRVKGVVTVLPLKSVRLAKGSPAVQPSFKEPPAPPREEAPLHRGARGDAHHTDAHHSDFDEGYPHDPLFSDDSFNPGGLR